MRGIVEIQLGLQRLNGGGGTSVVVKRIRKELAGERHQPDEFFEEARIARQLAHVNIVQVLDVGEDESGYYLAMEHVHGKSLRSVLGALAARVSVLPVEQALHIAIQITTALAHAHECTDSRGKKLEVVHGALSPDNVFVTFAGDVKVAEFGLLASRGWTADPALVAYPAPEQSRGEPPDPRTDLYALGMLMLELTTGKAPIQRPPEFGPSYPPKLAAIFLQAAARRRAHRHPRATELLAELAAFAKKNGTRPSAAALARLLCELFPNAGAQILRERREAMLLDAPHDQVRTIPNFERPTPASEEITRQDVPSASSGPPSEPKSVGLRPLTTAPPTARSWRPESQTTRYAVIGAAFGSGLIVGLSVGAFGGKPSRASSIMAPSPIDSSSSIVSFARSGSRPPLVEAQGSLDVQSEPSGANIFLEGDLLAELTPATLSGLPLGRPLRVRVSHLGFEPYETEVVLRPETPRDRVATSLSPATFTLQLSIDAEEPSVWVDGKYTSLRTLPGLAVDEDHKIAVSAPGRIGKVMIFHSEQGGEKLLEVKLDPIRTSR